jgi:hypothetical protein
VVQEYPQATVRRVLIVEATTERQARAAPHTCKVVQSDYDIDEGGEAVTVECEIAEKSCSRCKLMLPLDAFYVKPGVGSEGDRQAYCRRCCREYAQERSEEREAEALREDVAAVRALRAAGFTWKADDPEWDAAVNAALAAEDLAAAHPETNGAGGR